MTYNTSTNRVEKWKAQLDQLLSGQEVIWQTTEPHKVAYQIREAIAAAKYNKLEPYASIDYVFTQQYDRVIGRPRASLLVISHAQKLEHEAEKNEFDVIATMGKITSGTHVFPNFSGSTDKVRKWAQAKGFTLTEDPLTLSK